MQETIDSRVQGAEGEEDAGEWGAGYKVQEMVQNRVQGAEYKARGLQGRCLGTLSST